MIRPYCFSLPAPARISLLGLTMGSVRFSLYLLLVSCVYRSNAHGSLPTDVLPALIHILLHVPLTRMTELLRRL